MPAGWDPGTETTGVDLGSQPVMGWNVPAGFVLGNKE